MADPPESKTLNVADRHFSQCGRLTRDATRKGENVIHCVVDLQVMEKRMSGLEVVEILVALKATVNRNVNSHYSQNFGSSES